MSDYPEDMGRSTSWALAEVRTVLNRARTALESIGTDPTKVLWKVQFSAPQFDGPADRYSGHCEEIAIEHPGAAEMIHGLQEAVRLLEPFEKTGRTKYEG